MQPTSQGANSGPTMYLHKVSEVRRGAQSVAEKYDAGQQAMIRTETQWMETVWQISAIIPQVPTDTESMTAADVLRLASMVMSSRALSDLLADNGAGILRITDVRTPTATDDHQRYIYAPNFDFTITHKFTTTSTVPVVDRTEYRLRRV